MRSGWTLYGLPMDAREQAGNYQVFYAPVSLIDPFIGTLKGTQPGPKKFKGSGDRPQQLDPKTFKLSQIDQIYIRPKAIKFKVLPVPI